MNSVEKMTNNFNKVIDNLTEEEILRQLEEYKKTYANDGYVIKLCKNVKNNMDSLLNLLIDSISVNLKLKTKYENKTKFKYKDFEEYNEYNPEVHTWTSLKAS